METTNCFLCGNNNNNVEEMGIFRDIEFGIPGDFPLVRCRKCGLMYYRERPNLKEIKKYYPETYQPFRKAIQDEKYKIIKWARLRNLNKRINLIDKYCQHTPGKILDVGCSTGIFLDAMRTRGWQVQGVDISSTAVKYAKDKFSLDVKIGQITNISFPKSSFNVLTFWYTLEHIFDPLSSLLKARDILCDDGIIVITIPQWESLDRKIFKNAWVGFDAPRHLQIYTRSVIKNLLSASGFKIIRTWSGFGGYYTFLASLRLWLNLQIKNHNYRNNILKFLHIPGLRFIFSPFFKLLDLIGLGNSLVIVASKL